MSIVFGASVFGAFNGFWVGCGFILVDWHFVSVQIHFWGNVFWDSFGPRSFVGTLVFSIVATMGKKVVFGFEAGCFLWKQFFGNCPAIVPLC